MTDKTTEEMLSDLFEGRDDDKPYRLNLRLRLRPWWPPLCQVWRQRDIDPAQFGQRYGGSWPDARAYVLQLHAEYLAAKERSR